MTDFPWQPPPVQPQDGNLDIPAVLKRDASNVAPWMRKLPSTLAVDFREPTRVISDDLYGALAKRLNPSNNLPAKALAVPLPWEPKT